MDPFFNLFRSPDTDREVFQNLKKKISWPWTESFKDCHKVVSTEYSCEGNVCDYTPVLDALSQNVDLRKIYDMKGSSVEFFHLLQRNRENPEFIDAFLPHVVDSICMSKNGFLLFEAKRKGAPGNTRSVHVPMN